LYEKGGWSNEKESLKRKERRRVTEKQDEKRMK
jgi:hypothetical protein